MSESLPYEHNFAPDIARVYTIYEYLHENKIENT